MPIQEGLGPPPPQQAFMRWNDVRGTELIGLNRDGSIYTFGGIVFGDGTTQITAGGAGGNFLPLTGGTMTGPITGNTDGIDGNWGNFTNGLSLTDTAGNTINSGLVGTTHFISLGDATGSYGISIESDNGGSIAIFCGGGGFTLSSEGLVIGAPFKLSTSAVLQWGSDTGLSRTGPNTLALGNGTSVDASGSLMLTNVLTQPVTPPTSTGTAGTQGQITSGTDGNLYFCSVTGTAGSATWNVLTMTPV